MGCADGDNGRDWYDNFCSAAPFRLGCPRAWWEAESDPSCGGAAAGQPGVPLVRDYVIVEQPANLSTVTARLDDEAVAFILAHSSSNASSSSSDDTDAAPFFLYYAMPHMHAPQAHAPAFKGASTSKTVYGDTLREADHSVGRVVAALDQADVALNTLLIFTSDNGPWNIKGDWTLTPAEGDAACREASGNPLPNAATVGGLAGSQGIFQGAWQASNGGGGGTGVHNMGKAVTVCQRSSDGQGEFRPVPWREPRATLVVVVAAAATAMARSLPCSQATSTSCRQSSLAAVPLPADRSFDGFDLGPILFGAPAEQWPNRTSLLHPGPAQTVEAARVLGNRYKVLFKTCAAAACGELYYECGHESNATLVFDLIADPSESSPLEPSSDDYKVAVAAAEKASADFAASLESGLQTSTDFAYGAGPPSWPCADPTQLSCRRLVEMVPAAD